MKIYFFYNSKLRTNLDGILSKNLLRNRLIRPEYKFAKLVTKTISKMWKPKTYNKVIDNSNYGNRWYKVIDKEL